MSNMGSGGDKIGCVTASSQKTSVSYSLHHVLQFSVFKLQNNNVSTTVVIIIMYLLDTDLMNYALLQEPYSQCRYISQF